MKYVIGGLVSFFFSATVFSAELIPDRDIRLLVVNEVETESTTKPVAVNNGFVQVVAKVSSRVGQGSKKRVFDSAPFIISFEATDKDLTLVAPRLRDYEQAVLHFKGTPDIKLLVEGEEVEYRYDQLPAKQGFMPFQDELAQVKEYNQQNRIFFGEQAELASKAQVVSTSSASVGAAAVTGTVAAASVASNTTVDSAVVSAANTASAPAVNTNLQQLQAWYTKASKAERKEFRRWMIDQE
ncbi:DUF2057 family protein [Vibrio sp. TH_r3]|uniref:DUF2057 family protein n=1 Tax=Vibrio sp. TH_r3 TaxID=3082084 RepID=UPI002955CCE2|nr:DUF2057 family protein [Vibrio sp. TH_r3]MDV7103908.1 DUF2057 family protein [Vibrio sp. TH_r3]